MDDDMRSEFLAGCQTAREARKLAPWACVVRKVCGGYMAWESVVDADTWRRQK